MKRCTVIYNPKSGKGIKDKKLEQIEKILLNNNYKATFIKSEYPSHIKDIVEKLEYTDLLMSIGGDGTFNEVINGNLNRHSQLLVAHIPVGTTNDLGTMYGYKKSIVKNLKMVLKGEVKEMDLCSVGKDIFTYSFGIGQFTDISYNTSKKSKKRLGYMAYLINGVKELIELKHPLYNIKLQIDNKFYSETCSLILISNSNTIAGIKNFYKDIKLDDSEFEILVCNLTDRKRIIKSLASLTTKDVTSLYGFKTFKAKYLKIWFDNNGNKSWTLDGEEYKSRSKTYEIKIDKKIKVLIPKNNIKKLFV